MKCHALGSGGRFAFFSAEGLENLRQRGLRGGLSYGDEFVGAREIVPHERLDVRLDDDLSLLAPGDVGVTLNDRKRAADHVGGCAWCGEAAGFQVDRDGDIRAEQQRAFDGNWRGKEAIDQRAAFELYGHEQAGIRAGSAQRRAERSTRVVDRNALGDVACGDSQWCGEFLERFLWCESLEISLEAQIVGEA